MADLLIVADDFTGALDTGVQFAKQGISTIVSNEPDELADLSEPSFRVIVVNTESRHLTPIEAARRVREAVEWGVAQGIPTFYKKTDSTLRGNIGAELTALLDSVDGDRLIFVPAFPATGRTTEEGIQYVDGVPIHRSRFAEDQLNPIEQSYVPDIIHEQSSVEVVLVRRDHYADFESLIDEAEDKAILMFDAETEEDLRAIGDSLKVAGGDYQSFAGCAGFSNVLPDVIGLTSDSVEFGEGGVPKRTLVVSGSLNPTSLRQVAYMERHGTKTITLSPEQALSSSDGDRVFDELIELIETGFEKKDEIIVRTLVDRSDLDSYIAYARERDIKPEEVHRRVARSVGRLVQSVLEEVEIGYLVVFGGDTARGVVDALDCSGIVPKTEIVPGVVFSEISWHGRILGFVTKAGGFGEEDVLHSIERFVERIA